MIYSRQIKHLIIATFSLVQIVSGQQSGLLTAADIDDNLNFEQFLDYKDDTVHSQSHYQQDQLPNPYLANRVAVRVKDVNGNPYSCANVHVGDNFLPTGTNGLLWVFPWYDEVSEDQPATWNLNAAAPDEICNYNLAACLTTDYVYNTAASVGRSQYWSPTSTIDMQIPQVSQLPNKLDLAFIIDTTGSMCDELRYLQAELSSVIAAVTDNAEILASTGSIDVRLSIVLYRDHGDTYTVDATSFSTLSEGMETLQRASCGGGGDYEEAMDEAMASARQLSWRSGNVARVAFVVADAPPHDWNLQSTLDAALGLRKLGVRVYGLAASGVARNAEYLMRLMALVTGARYAWLTDDSGIGNPHAEPTVECYQVTRLDQLLIRVLTGEMLGKRVEAKPDDILREKGNQVNGICLVDVQLKSANATMPDGGGGGGDEESDAAAIAPEAPAEEAEASPSGGTDDGDAGREAVHGGEPDEDMGGSDHKEEATVEVGGEGSSDRGDGLEYRPASGISKLSLSMELTALSWILTFLH